MPSLKNLANIKRLGQLRSVLVSIETFVDKVNIFDIWRKFRKFSSNGVAEFDGMHINLWKDTWAPIFRSAKKNFNSCSSDSRQVVNKKAA